MSSLVMEMLGFGQNSRLVVGLGECDAADLDGNEGADLIRMYIDRRYANRYVLVLREDGERVWASGSPHVFVNLDEGSAVYVEAGKVTADGQ